MRFEAYLKLASEYAEKRYCWLDVEAQMIRGSYDAGDTVQESVDRLADKYGFETKHATGGGLWGVPESFDFAPYQGRTD